MHKFRPEQPNVKYTEVNYMNQRVNQSSVRSPELLGKFSMCKYIKIYTTDKGLLLRLINSGLFNHFSEDQEQKRKYVI